jgi:predicted metal-dependent phosphotriesterase family hydrolase
MNYPDDDTELIELAVACYAMCVLNKKLTPGRRANIRRAFIDVIKHTGVNEKDIQALIAENRRMTK